MSAKKITGRVEILANGILLLSKTGATANGIGESGKPAMERKPVMGDQGLQGFVEEPVEASLEVTVTDREDQKLNEFAEMNGDATVIFRSYGGGKSYVMENATCTNNLTVTSGEGEVALKFIGSYWTEGEQ